jgi:hypothetical protein
MSKHSKHGRGKHSHFKRSQRRHQMQMNARMMQQGADYMQPDSGTMQPTTDTVQPSGGTMQPTTGATPMTPKRVVSSSTPQMSGQKRPTTSTALPMHYEFISGDLKRIGILTVIILAILIALYFGLR